MFHIREVIVSPQVEEHIWVKHHVTSDEAEQVCFSEPWSLKSRDGGYSIYGQSEAGRYLAVFLYPRGRGVFNLASARDMNETERRRYQQHLRR